MSKGKPEPSPESAWNARQEIIGKATEQLQESIEQVASSLELSAAEVLSIMASMAADFAQTAMEVEHETYYGPRPDDE